MNRKEINQANSQHSTGPITDEGKQRSSMNALRHGLTSDKVVIPGEDPEIYDAHVQAFYDEHAPQTQSESVLVQLLADLSWRLLRVATVESNLLAQNINYSTFNDQIQRLTAFEKLTRSLTNLSLQSQRISRQLDKTLAELHNLKKTRPQPKSGFVFTAAASGTVGQAVLPAAGFQPANDLAFTDDPNSPNNQPPLPGPAKM